MPWSMGYGECIDTTPPTTPGEPLMPCDCGATREDIAAGIHAPNCTSHEGTQDDPSDHYGQ